METRCEKCGASVNAEQPFCSKCGAVVGMAGAKPKRDEGWDMVATVVGKKGDALPSPSKPTAPKPRASRTDATHTQAAPVAPTARGSNTVMLAVIGFVVVLLIGGLLIWLLYMR
jgi:hypothetical protein